MKIRNGFVSNSSTSSFCIYGANISNKQFRIFDDIQNFPLCLYTAYEEYYVGRSWKHISDDMTGKQYKFSIEEAIKDVFKEHNFPIEDLKFETFEEAYHD